MPIEVTCDSCQKRLRVPDTTAGKKIKCPQCQGVISVPAAGGAPVSEAPAAAANTQDSWFLKAEDGEDYGPVSKNELDQWFEEGRITADCQVLREGDEQWQWASSVYTQLEAEAAPAAAPTPAPAPAVSPAPAAAPTPAAGGFGGINTGDGGVGGGRAKKKKKKKKVAAKPVVESAAAPVAAANPYSAPTPSSGARVMIGGYPWMQKMQQFGPIMGWLSLALGVLTEGFIFYTIVAHLQQIFVWQFFALQMLGAFATFVFAVALMFFFFMGPELVRLTNKRQE